MSVGPFIKVPSLSLRSDLEKFQEETLQKINDVTRQQDQKINDVTRQQDQNINDVRKQQDLKMSALQVSTERNLSSVAEAYRSTGKVIMDVSLQVFITQILANFSIGPSKHQTAVALVKTIVFSHSLNNFFVGSPNDQLLTIHWQIS